MDEGVEEARRAGTTGGVRVLGWAAPMALSVAAATAGIAPRLAPGTVLVFTLLLAALAWREGGLGAALRSVPLRRAAAPLALTGLVLASGAWTFAPRLALAKAGLLLAVTLASLAVAPIAAGLSPLVLRRHARGLALGLGVGLAFALTEIGTGLGLTRLAVNMAPVLLSDRLKGMVGTAGDIQAMAPFLMNRNVVALLLLFWPALLIARVWPVRSVGRIGTALLAIAMAGAVLLSDSETAKAALVASAIVFALACTAPKAALRLVGALWCSGVLLAVPVAMVPSSLGMGAWQGLPESARDRVGIWRFTASHVPDRPLLGHGVRGARALAAGLRAGQPAPSHRAVMFTERPGRHAHNGYLQIWLDLGAAGAGLFMGLGLALLCALARLPGPALAHALATFAAGALVLAFGWGLWQSWLIASLALAVAAMVLAVAFMPQNKY